MAPDHEACESIIKLVEWRDAHEKRHTTLDDILDKLLNRLPLWATTIAAIGGATIGSLLTIIFFLAREAAR